MTTTDTTARLLGSFVSFADAVRTEYTDRMTEALREAHSGNYGPGRSLVAEYDTLRSLIADVVEGFAVEFEPTLRIYANDAAANMAYSLVPIVGELCDYIDHHDPVTIAKSEAALMRLIGEEQFRELQAAGEV